MTKRTERRLLTLLAVGFGGSLGIACGAALAQPGGIAGILATTSDPNDFYYYDGKPVRLSRSLTECVASFKIEALREKQKLVESLGLHAELGKEVRSEGRAFHLVTIPRPDDGAAGIARLVERLRTKDEVDFVGAVFYRPETRRRLLPTDEILVKLKPERTPQELAEIAASLALTIRKPVRGTRDEYVLALDRPKTADPLEKARLLHESGRFQWAEPNFIQELEVTRRFP